MNMELADDHDHDHDDDDDDHHHHHHHDHDLATGVAHGRWQAKPRSKFAGEKITHGLKLEEN